MKKIIIIGFSFLFFGCNEQKNENKEAQKKETQIKDENLISDACAIFVSPTDKQIDSIKATMPEEDFYIVADDNMFYISKARDYLKSQKVKIYDKESVGVLKFRKTDGNVSELQLSGLFWKLILFNGKKKPTIVDITAIEDEFKNYMK
ncbi:MAG: hypothetical protein ACT4ON_13345 [Bacteroidota bacterium]